MGSSWVTMPKGGRCRYDMLVMAPLLSLLNQRLRPSWTLSFGGMKKLPYIRINRIMQFEGSYVIKSVILAILRTVSLFAKSILVLMSWCGLFVVYQSVCVLRGDSLFGGYYMLSALFACRISCACCFSTRCFTAIIVRVRAQNLLRLSTETWNWQIGFLCRRVWFVGEPSPQNSRYLTLEKEKVSKTPLAKNLYSKWCFDQIFWTPINRCAAEIDRRIVWWCPQ